MANPVSIPTNPTFALDRNSLYITSQAAHNDIANLFVRSNQLYNMSSVTEDIISARYLAIQNATSSIMAGNFSGKDYVVESFSSQGYVDQSFKVDSALNIDTQNNLATLPVVHTEDIKVDSIIIESDSNGSMGNSFNNYANNDISSILTSDASQLFEYEKVTNIFTSTTLCLSLTLKLATKQITNATFIKLYADENTVFPAIELIEVSADGSSWVNVNFSSKVNQNDYFIRFDPINAQYIKIRFAQSTYNYINTTYGGRYRYLIGIRQISPKRIEYDTSGDYISIPFSGKSSMNAVSFNADDKSGEDISYYISANNGGRWVAIKNSETLSFNNESLGLRGDVDVDSIRVKINMAKSVMPNQASLTEKIPYTNTDSYNLKNKPSSLSGYIGGHISCGDLKEYVFQISDIASLSPDVIESKRIVQPLFFLPFSSSLLERLVLKLNGVRLVNTHNIYNVIRHSNPMHSVLVLDLSSYPLTGVLSVSLMPEVSSSNIISLTMPLLDTSPSSISIDNGTATLSSKDFKIKDRNTIEILPSAYEKGISYSISYIPAVDITSSIKFSSDTNLVVVPIFSNIPTGITLSFDYTYQNISSYNISKYYTPFCYNYRIELS